MVAAIKKRKPSESTEEQKPSQLSLTHLGCAVVVSCVAWLIFTPGTGDAFANAFREGCQHRPWWFGGCDPVEFPNGKPTVTHPDDVKPPVVAAPVVSIPEGNVNTETLTATTQTPVGDVFNENPAAAAVPEVFNEDPAPVSGSDILPPTPAAVVE